jgi:hypothetical protein
MCLKIEKLDTMTDIIIKFFFNYFDYIDLFDSSKFLKHPTHILSFESGKVSSITKIPDYLKSLIRI